MKRVLCRSRLLRSFVILEWKRAALELDEAVLADGKLDTDVVADVERSEHRSPNSPWVAQPLVRADVGEAGRLSSAVVLVDDGAPPVEHLLLDCFRAWSSRMN